MKKPLTFTLAERIALSRAARQATRDAQAQRKRVLGRLAIEERLRQAYAKLTNFEDAAAIGRLLTALHVTTWKKALIKIGISSPQQALDQEAALAKAQLKRFIEEEAPALLERNEAVARAIETNSVASSTAEPPFDDEAPEDAPPSPDPKASPWG